MTDDTRLLTVRFDLEGAAPPVFRVAEVYAETRMTAVHRLTAELFGWTAEVGHRFTDQPAPEPHDHDHDHDHDPSSGGVLNGDYVEPQWYGWSTRSRGHRVWETCHGHSWSDWSHTSECEHVDTLGRALDSAGSLYYEYGVDHCRHCERPQRWRDDGDDGGDGPRAWPLPIVRLTLVDARRRRANGPNAHLVNAVGWPPLTSAATDGAKLDDRYPFGYDDGYGGYLPEAPSDARWTAARPDSWGVDLDQVRLGVQAGPWATALGPIETRPLDPAALRAVLTWPGNDQRDAARRKASGGLFRVLSASERWPQSERIAVVQHALSAGLDRTSGDHPSTDAAIHAHWAKAVTAELCTSLTALASSRGGGPGPADPAVEIDPEHETRLRSLRLAYRKAGHTVRSRRGNAALADPLLVVRECAEAYWAAGDTLAAVAVAFEFAAGAPLIALDPEDAGVARCRAFIMSCGDLAPCAEAEDAARFARFLLAG